MSNDEKLVFLFDEIDEAKFSSTEELKEFFGGKGAGLASMTKMGLPIPYGFNIPCKFSLYYAKNKEWPTGLKDQVNNAIHKVEEKSGKKVGDQKKEK